MMRVMLTLLVVLLLQAHPVSGEERAGIAAKINGEIVTWEEVELALRNYPAEQRTDELRQSELRRIAEDRLFLQFAKKQGIEISDREVDEAIKIDKKQLAGGEERFEDYLRFKNMTLAQYREHRRNRLMVKTLLRRLATEAFRQPNFRSVLLWESVTPEELREYYAKHKEEFQAINHVTFLRIGVTYDPAVAGDKELKKRLLESLQRKLAEGSDFYALAASYSDVFSQTGNGKPVPLYKELRREQSAFAEETNRCLFEKMQNAGEVSPILEDGNTLNLFKLLQLVNAKQESFEEAQLTIRKQIESRKSETNQRVLRGVLLEQSYIEPAGLFGS